MAEFLNKSGGVFTAARDNGGKPITDVAVMGEVNTKLTGGSSLYCNLASVPSNSARTRLDNIECREVTVIARKSNTGSIFVGGEDVSATKFGVELEANESFTFVVKNANMIYIAAEKANEGVSYVAI